MRWIFHVGYPKCASTSIQNSLRNASGFHFCGRNRGHYSGENGTYVARQILAPATKHTVDHDAVTKWRLDVERIAREQGHDTIVVSDEKFTNLSMEKSPIATFEMLSEIFKDKLEIVIVVRNHWSILRSSYKQKVKSGVPVDWTHFCLFNLFNKEKSFF